MKARCYRPRNKEYDNYGGRGITVCAEWKDSFETFLADMGQRPSPSHSIERTDNERGYSADNCQWATAYDQSRNTRQNVYLTHDGETLVLSDWARRLGLDRRTIHARLQAGWTVASALNPQKR